MTTECRALAAEPDEGSRAAYRRAASLYARGKPLLQPRPEQAAATATCLGLYDRARGRTPLPGSASVCFPEHADVLDAPCSDADAVTAHRSTSASAR